jgi:hypothetical protein
MEVIMRNLFVTGTAVAFLAAGAAGAANAANANVPASSPYALMDVAPQSAPYSGDGHTNRGLGYDRRSGAEMVEGRAAYVDGDPGVASRRHPDSRGGDVVVHTGRSYLDPGTSAEVGTEDRYFYDTAHYDFHSEGPDFTRNVGGFELLPGQFGPN